MMRRLIPFAGSKAYFFVGSVAERFILRSPTAAEIDRAVFISLASSIYSMTAGPKKLYVPGNHIRSIQSRGNPNAHFLLLPASNPQILRALFVPLLLFVPQSTLYGPRAHAQSLAKANKKFSVWRGCLWVFRCGKAERNGRVMRVDRESGRRRFLGLPSG